MPRPDRSDERRRDLLPAICRAFCDLGYRRATTAELAKCCGVQENVLYRLWPDKKAMFLAAIDDVFVARAAAWETVLSDAAGAEEVVERLVRYEAKHQGEFGFYRIVFTALAETDDKEIRAALVAMYRRFQRLVSRQVQAGRVDGKTPPTLAADDAAWGLLGLATISNVVRELHLLSPRRREQAFAAIAHHLVTG